VNIRVGTGFDAHAFGPGDSVALGGVRIAHSHGVVANSDGDVILHALCDALLGAAGLGDIGQHFPDTDPAYRGADSARLLEQVVGDLAERGWQVVNADVCLIGERPKIGPHRQRMRDHVAPLLGLSPEALNVKATTTEQLGFTGRAEGLAAQAVVLIQRD
jgi:2-C-methyl-D-erythritol 2,4-cyclodiphosphate synthase